MRNQATQCKACDNQIKSAKYERHLERCSAHLEIMTERVPARDAPGQLALIGNALVSGATAYGRGLISLRTDPVMCLFCWIAFPVLVSVTVVLLQ